MFERYQGESSKWIPREQLSTVTKRNLRWLEKEYGFQFQDQARRAQFGHAPSYIIHGTNPQGEEVVYERRETSGRGAGQTYIWVNGRRHRLVEYRLPEPVNYIKKRKLEDLTMGALKLVDTEGLSESEIGGLVYLIRGLGPSKEEKKKLEEYLDGYKRELGGVKK